MKPGLLADLIVEGLSRCHGTSPSIVPFQIYPDRLFSRSSSGAQLSTTACGVFIEWFKTLDMAVIRTNRYVQEKQRVRSGDACDS
jgi:hypothetical protein